MERTMKILRIGSSPTGVRIEAEPDDNELLADRYKLAFQGDHFELKPALTKGKHGRAKTYRQPNGKVHWTFTATAVIVVEPFNNMYEMPYFKVSSPDRYLCRENEGSYFIWPKWEDLQPLRANGAETRAGVSPPRGRPPKTEKLSAVRDTLTAPVELLSFTHGHHPDNGLMHEFLPASPKPEGPSAEELTTMLIQAMRNLNGVIKLADANPHIAFNVAVTQQGTVRLEFE
jgi:hypothetical protein